MQMSIRNISTNKKSARLRNTYLASKILSKREELKDLGKKLHIHGLSAKI